MRRGKRVLGFADSVSGSTGTAQGGLRVTRPTRMTATCCDGVPSPIKLDRVYNFRSVLSGYPGVPLYRSAALDNMTSHDADRLLNALNVSCVIDLRNRDEILKQGAFRSMQGATEFYSAFTTAPSASYPRKMLPSRLRYELPLLDDFKAFWDGVQQRSVSSRQEELQLSFLWLFNGQELMKVLALTLTLTLTLILILFLNLTLNQ